MKIEGGVSKSHHHKLNGMKMTMSTGSTMTPKIHRKVIRTASKLHPGKLHPGKLHAVKRQPGKTLATKSILGHQHQMHSGKLVTSRGKMLARVPPLTRPIDSCDNSNDSGLGFDQMEVNITPKNNCLRFSEHLESSWKEDTATHIENCKSDLKFESDDANDNFNFHETATRTPKQLCTTTTYRNVINGGKVSSASNRRKPAHTLSQNHSQDSIGLYSQLLPHTKDGRVYLQIVSQPEQQHRARYQTEGSRGAVKDRSGNGFPIVKLVGYDRPASLQVFIGTDVGRVAPHMFYQACRVFGKNSTPCTEGKQEGTMLINIDFDPQKNWQILCDCVGILKERNVDVEHRLGDHNGGERVKKKSTRCRMIFRTQVINSDDVLETIQVCSQPIVCTQPPGIPEICRKSLVSCPASGGLELFLLGKNFLKDTKVVFQMVKENSQPPWEECVIPDKEFLQQNHLVCCVPPFVHLNISEPVAIKLFVVSGEKASEPHEFFYTPYDKNSKPLHATIHHSVQGVSNGQYGSESKEEAKPILLWETGKNVGMMLPPAIPHRRPSLILPDPISPPISDFKTEVDDSSQGSLLDNDKNEIISRHNHQISNDNVTHDANSNMSMMVTNNTLTTPVCRITENNVDMLIHHNDTTNMSVVEENSFNQTPIMSQQMVTSSLLNDSIKNQTSSVNCGIMNAGRHMSADELKVMDLRMKPETIENDNNSLVSMQRFELTQVNGSHNKLPTQSSESVENYLSNIENKAMLPQNIEKPLFSQELVLQTHNTDRMMESVTAAIFQSTTDSASRTDLYTSQTPVQRVVLPSVTPIEQLIASKQMQDSMMSNMISRPLEESHAKTEMYQSISNDTLTATDQMSHQTLINNQISAMDTLVPTIHPNIISSPTATTSKLDTLINSSVENHLSPTRSEPSPRRSPSSHDIILSSHSSPDLVIASNTSQISPVNQELIHPHNANVLSPEIILNPQVSPTLMCSQDGTLLNSQSLSTTMSQQLLPNAHNLTQNTSDNLMIMTNEQTNQSLIQSPHLINPTVKTPQATMECMLLDAAAKILTSETAINALVTTAINSANILNDENVQNQSSLICSQSSSVVSNELDQSKQQTVNVSSPSYSTNLPFASQVTQQYSSRAINNAVDNFVSQIKQESVAEPPTMTQVVTQAVSQAVSQVVNEAFNQVVNQEIKSAGSAPMRVLTTISDNELLSYINPSCFDQV